VAGERGALDTGRIQKAAKVFDERLDIVAVVGEIGPLVAAAAYIVQTDAVGVEKGF